MSEIAQQTRIFRHPVDLHTLAATADIPPGDLDTATLLEAGILTRTADDLFLPCEPLAEPPAETAARAARHLYHHHWRQNPQALALHRELLRLAIAGQQADIAFEVADHIAGHYLHQGDFDTAKAICEQALALGEDFALQHTLGLCELSLGNLQAAKAHLQSALAATPASEDAGVLGEKASILHHLADAQAATGSTFRAAQHWQDAADIFAGLGEITEQAIIIEKMAQLFAQQGDQDSATDYWHLALMLWEQAGQSLGIAHALAQLARLAQQQDDKAHARALEERACKALAEAGEWRELALLLNKIGIERHDAGVLIQSFWLALAVDAPLELLVDTGSRLLNEFERDTQEGATLAAAMLNKVEQEYSHHDRFAELHRIALDAFLSCARQHGVAETRIYDWMHDCEFDQAGKTLHKAREILAARVNAADWLFNPSLPGNLN